MSVQDNVTAARRLLKEAFGDGDLSVIDELVAHDFIEHQDPVQGIGPEAVKERVLGLHQSLSEMRFDIEALIAGEDTVWTRSRVTARNSRSFTGWPATGTVIEIDVIDVIRFSAGKAVEHWGVADRLGLLEQLGLADGGKGRAA